MSRRTARKNAFYLLYQMEFASDNELEETKKIFFDELKNNIDGFDELKDDLDDKDYEFILLIVDGVKKNIKEIDKFISDVSIGWSIERISKIDLSILRIAIYEMKFIKETPISVIINEAINIAKKYSSDGAPSFINGVLGKLV